VVGGVVGGVVFNGPIGAGGPIGPGAIDLDGHFGLNPALQPLKALWDKQQLAIIEATGSPDSTRSHFECQDQMESGMAGKVASDGWLNRALLPPGPQTSPLRAVAMGSQLPHTFSALKMVRSINQQGYQPQNGAQYGQGFELGQSLQQIARLIKADVGVEAAFAEVGGWDHHQNENNQLSNLLRQFGSALAAFSQDMGDRMEDIVLVTMSEFGRTAQENGNAGTDHGHGDLMMVLGGPVRGGKIYGKWPGLEKEQLFEGRDLAVTTDYRDVLGELVSGHLGQKNLAQVFPGYEVGKPLGLLKV
jgi:uncharacterized protein (DUF1501 family)